MQSNEGRLELAKAVIDQEMKSLTNQPATAFTSGEESGQD
jgi:hypothetical protein